MFRPDIGVVNLVLSRIAFVFVTRLELTLIRVHLIKKYVLQIINRLTLFFVLLCKESSCILFTRNYYCHEIEHLLLNGIV